MKPILHALALAFALICAHPVARAQATPAATETVRADMAPMLELAQKLMAEGKPAEALAPLAQAQALPNRSAYENFIIDQLQGQAAARATQDVLALDAFDRAVAAGRYAPQDLLAVQRLQLQLAYRAKLWSRSTGYARALLKLPGLPADARLTAQQLLGQALYLDGKFAESATEVTAFLDGLAASGTKPEEAQIKLLASAYLQLKDEAAYAGSLERMVAAHPTPAYWADLIARRAPSVAPNPRLRLELLRLARVTGAFADAEALLEAADVATQLGLPGEARQVLKSGLDAGKFKPGADTSAAQQQWQRVTAAAAKDSAANESQQTSGLAPQALFGLGHALALDGQAARGLPLMEQALQKGGLREPGTARLQLGTLQALAGRNEARATLQGVPAGDAASGLARLWLLHLR